MNFFTTGYRSRQVNIDLPGHYLHAGGGIFLFSLLLYTYTLAPAVVWGDSAKFALNVNGMHLGYRADDHPLFIIVGKTASYIMPFDLGYSLNLLTALSASIAVLFVYLAVFELTGSKIAAAAGSLALSVSHAFWTHAVLTEVYDLNAAFLASIIYVLVKWRQDTERAGLLYTAAFLFGLGLTNHRILVFDLAGILVFVLINEPSIFRKMKKLLYTAVSFVAGGLLIIYLVILDSLSKPVMKVADTFSAENYKKAFIQYSPDILKETGLYFSYLFYQFPLIGFLLGFAGLAALSRNDRKSAVLFLLLIIVNAVFFMKFGPSAGSSKYTFYISAYTVFSILIGYGTLSFLNFLQEKNLPLKTFSFIVVLLLLLLPVASYNITPIITKSLGIDLLHARSLPYRDNDHFFLNPSKRGYYGSEKYAMDVFNTAGKNSIILADYSPYTVLKYYQEIKGLREDLTIIMPGSRTRYKDGTVRPNIIKNIVSANYGKKTLYLADMEDETYYRLDPIRDRYDFIPHGILYRIVKKEDKALRKG